MPVFGKRISHRDEFELAARYGKADLLIFTCDDEDGPVTVFFDPELLRCQIDLATLRRLLDDAETAPFEQRREWQAMPPLEE